MPLSPTDLIQSFRLRFWRESLEEGTGAWRGDVWHEQQAPEQKATVVVSPEAAFDLVRRALQRSPPPHPAGFHVAERDGRRHAVRYDIGGGAEAAGRAALDLAKTPENATMTAARAIGGGMASWTRHSISPIRRLLILSPELASFRRRGFAAADRSKQTALELIGRTFIGGYNAAVAGGIEDVLRHVAAGAPTERGFGSEGAAMAAGVARAGARPAGVRGARRVGRGRRDRRRAVAPITPADLYRRVPTRLHISGACRCRLVARARAMAQPASLCGTRSDPLLAGLRRTGLPRHLLRSSPSPARLA